MRLVSKIEFDNLFPIPYFFNCALAADCDGWKFNVLDGLSSGGNSGQDRVFLPFRVSLKQIFQNYKFQVLGSTTT